MTLAGRLMAHPLPYLLWQAPFAERKLAPVWRHLERSGIERVLDVGCGPGTNAHHFEQVDYVGLDVNPRYIEHARRRHRGTFVVADVTSYEVPDRERFDLVLVNSLLHHLDPPDTSRLVSHLRSLLTAEGSIHILELVLPERPGVARLLARADRGEFPRPLAEWRELLGRELAIEVFEPYSLGIGGVGLWHMLYVKGSARR